jgi:outer membrane protein TolC
MRYALLAMVLATMSTATAQQPAALTVDLQNALERAKVYGPQFLSADVAMSLAQEDRVQARAALLPTLNGLSQFIYTQPNGTPSGVFIANDGPHVYSDQALVQGEPFSYTKWTEYRRSQAAEAAAKSKKEIAARGLASTVIQSYYALATAQRHLANSRLSVDEAQRFLSITQKQEAGGEVARAYVIKAQLQFQQRQRELNEAGTGAGKASIALAVLLFADVDQAFSIVDDLSPNLPMPALEEIRGQALPANPEVLAAEAGVRVAGYGLKAARSAYLPTFTVDYFYGINANVFAKTGPEGRQNLGSAVQGTLNIPVWNWGATQSKIRQAQLQKRQSEIDLNAARRQLQANIGEFYLEAQTARAQLESLSGSLVLAAESLRLALLRYEAGEATALEVVDAQTTNAEARNARDDGLARYRLALANLQTLTGRF